MGKKSKLCSLVCIALKYAAQIEHMNDFSNQEDPESHKGALLDISSCRYNFILQLPFSLLRLALGSGE